MRPPFERVELWFFVGDTSGEGKHWWKVTYWRIFGHETRHNWKPIKSWKNRRRATISNHEGDNSE